MTCTTRKPIIHCLIIISILITTLDAGGQVLTVPYRVGDKFGIADLSGRMLIPPRYTWVDVHDPEKRPFLVGFTTQDTSKPRSTLIEGIKVLLRDQPYAAYYRYGRLFKACAYDEKQLGGRRSKDRFTETDALYTTDGKPVLVGEYKDIYVYTDMDPGDRMSEVLVHTTNYAGGHSLRIYSKAEKKITKILYDNAELVRLVDNMEEVWRKDTSMEFFYRDGYGKGHRLQVGKDGRKLKVLANEEINLRKETDGERRGGYDAVEMPPDAYTQPLNAPKDSISLEMRSVSLKLSYYYLPRKTEELKIVKERLTQRESYLVIRDGKVGLQVPGQDTLVVPARYDEIMKADFPGQYGGYILRRGNKYGLFIFHLNQRYIIEPVYDHIPLLLTLNYSGKGATLVKLYDSSTRRFLYYADGKGKAYYRAK